MITIIFESHATSMDNEAGLASGWNDVALSELGEKQAKELGVRYVGQSFDAVFCSDLQRSYRTAEIAFGGVFPIMRDKRLRECDYGDMTQTSKDVVWAERPKHISEPFPGGESYEDCVSRMRSFIDELKQYRDGQTIMIIGHRATQYGLETVLRDLPLKDVVTASWTWQPGWRYESR